MRQQTPQFSPAASLRAAVAAIALLMIGSVAYAAPIQFADFHLVNATQPFSLTNNGGTSLTVQALSVPVVFNFTSQSGLPTADHNAILTINPAGTAATTLAAIAAGSLLDQPINPLNFSILDSSTGKNLLSLSTSSGDLVGMSGGATASLSGMNSGAYTSDFATFNASATRSYNLGLGTLSAPLSLGPGGFLNSFIANVNGQFTVDSGGFRPNTPEPASIVLSGLGALVFSALAISKRKRNGATRRAPS